MIIRFFICLFVVTSTYAQASSKATLDQTSQSELTIDSRDGLQCDRNSGTCQAEGHIVVRKGPYTMVSKQAIVFTDKLEGNKTEIQRIEAQGDVKFFGPDNETAACQKAIYNANEQMIYLTPSSGQKVTMWKDDYIIFSQKLDIALQDSQNSGTQIKQIVANGHVVLSSPEELVKADRAVYKPDLNVIHAYGNVSVNREQGQTRGSFAEVNLDTKQTKMIKRPDVKTDKDVQVFVYPDKSKGLSGRGRKQN